MPRDKENHNAWERTWRQKNPEKARARNAKQRSNPGYKAKMRAYQKKHHFRSTYGISVEQFDSMIEQQAGLCAICTKPMKPGHDTHIDHCHETNKVRAILCQRCNRGIGHFYDDTALISAAVKYLEVHQ